MMFTYRLEKEHMKECSDENTRNGALRAQSGFASSIEATLQKRMAKNMI
jgi:hypothetical protein